MNLAHLFIDAFSYSTGMSYSNGDFSASATAEGLGRWEENHKIVTIAGGGEKVASHELATDVAIPLNGLVWGPVTKLAPTQANALRVLSRSYARTFDGSYAYYIYMLGR